MQELSILKTMIDQAREKVPNVLSEDFLVSAAIQVLVFFLGEEWCEKIIFDQKRLKDVNYWFLNDGRPEHHSVRITRIVFLADTLFRLREVVGFDLLIGRFHNRKSDPKSCFLEAYAASEFINDNTIIQINKEVNMKGHDFDFTVIHSGCKINVEVTSKDAGNIRKKSFFNTLKHKHEQLPANTPSIIFVYISQAQNVSLNIQSHIKEAISEFLRRNLRVNRVVVFSDMIIKSNGNPFASFMGFVDFNNPNPRFDIPSSILDRTSFGRIHTRKLVDLNGSMPIGSIVYNLSATTTKNIVAKRSFLAWYYSAS